MKEFIQLLLIGIWDLVKRTIGNPFCKHDMKQAVEPFLIQNGTNKMWIYKCNKCPKERYETL